MWPASSTWLARTIPSSADWPVPWRSLSARSVRASLTASTGQRSLPSSSSRRSRTSPVVVSSVPPISSLERARRRWRARSSSRSAPSSIVTCGSPSSSARDVPRVGVEVLAAQRPHLDAVLEHERRRHVVLGRERVGRAQRDRARRRPSASGRGSRSRRSRAGRPRSGPRPAAARARSARAIRASTGIWLAAQAIRAAPVGGERRGRRPHAARIDARAIAAPCRAVDRRASVAVVVGLVRARRPARRGRRPARRSARSA